ncbi:GatB/YqeY domain-containing protein [Candidatus Roizmanbacteria bacterium]|nr:GatB/YqeY domain-containing protein [Candidatus Roizmanbacteria bacterium]
MLRAKIQADLLDALKSQEKIKLNTLRMVMSAIKYKEVEKKEELNDEEVLGIIRKQLKEIQESIDAFTKGNRADLLQEAEAQKAILTPFLPQELSDEELHIAIKKLVDDNQELIARNPKMIIGLTMKELRGKAGPDRIMKTLTELTS